MRGQGEGKSFPLVGSPKFPDPPRWLVVESDATGPRKGLAPCAATAEALANEEIWLLWDTEANVAVHFLVFMGGLSFAKPLLSFALVLFLPAQK